MSRANPPFSLREHLEANPRHNQAGNAVILMVAADWLAMNPNKSIHDWMDTKEGRKLCE